MQSSFTAISKVALEPELDTGKARLVNTDLRLELSEDIDKDVNLKDLPIKEGVDLLLRHYYKD